MPAFRPVTVMLWLAAVGQRGRFAGHLRGRPEPAVLGDRAGAVADVVVGGRAEDRVVAGGVPGQRHGVAGRVAGCQIRDCRRKCQVIVERRGIRDHVRQGRPVAFVVHRLDRKVVRGVHVQVDDGDVLAGAGHGRGRHAIGIRRGVPRSPARAGSGQPRRSRANRPRWPTAPARA